MHAMLRSLLNSWTGFRKASAVSGRRTDAVFSVCSLKPSGISNGGDGVSFESKEDGPKPTVEGVWISALDAANELIGMRRVDRRVR